MHPCVHWPTGPPGCGALQQPGSLGPQRVFAQHQPRQSALHLMTATSSTRLLEAVSSRPCSIIRRVCRLPCVSVPPLRSEQGSAGEPDEQNSSPFHPNPHRVKAFWFPSPQTGSVCIETPADGLSCSRFPPTACSNRNHNCHSRRASERLDAQTNCF